MADRSPFLRRKKNPKLPGYSTFDSRISKDSGISSNIEETASTKRGLKSSTVVEDASDRVSISWENIQVFVENPRPSIIKRLCSFGKSENEVVKSKQILFNGRLWNEFQFSVLNPLKVVPPLVVWLPVFRIIPYWSGTERKLSGSHDYLDGVRTENLHRLRMDS